MVNSILDHTPGTVMLTIERGGSLLVTLADDTIAVDLDATNRSLAAEADRMRGRGLLDGQVDPLVETVDGRLVLDEDHTYRLVSRDRRRPEVAVYQRVHPTPD